MATIFRGHMEINFLVSRPLYFDPNFNPINNKPVQVMAWQAMILTSDGVSCWRIFASLGLDQLVIH